MFQELKFQLSTAILTILTLAAGVAAVLNIDQQWKFRLHDDGVVWVDRTGGVEALEVPAESAGAKAGVHRGDRLVSINSVRIEKAIDVAKVLTSITAWTNAKYIVVNHGQEVEINKLVVAELPLDRARIYEDLVGFAYLFIGLFVYFRRGSAQKATHFYVLCLSSFIFFTFHATGQLNTLDKIIDYGNVAAGLIAPTIFLHFCLTFPEAPRWLQKPVRAAMLYVPALVLFAFYAGISSGALKTGVTLIEINWFFNRIWQTFAVLPYVIAGIALTIRAERAEDPIVRQQFKWVRNGTLCGILPFALLYVLPYAAGALPNEYLKMSVLGIVLIPLSLAYAIVRYRLMDVDIIFRRGYAYTLATICVLAAFYGLVFSLGSLVQKQGLGNTGVMTVMLIGAFLFQPIRNWIQ